MVGFKLGLKLGECQLKKKKGDRACEWKRSWVYTTVFKMLVNILDNSFSVWNVHK